MSLLQFLNNGYFAGSVGIGTDNPGTKLEVKSSANLNSFVNITTTTDAYNSGISLRQSSNYGFDVYYTDDGVSPSVRGLRFDRVNNGSVANAMFIDRNSGKVGIGTDDPGALLEISGIRENQIRLTSRDVTAAVDETIGGIEFYSSDSGNEGVKASISAIAGDNAANAYMTFNTGVNTEAMRITNVGGISFGSTGTAYGTSGQILKSNGNTTPTWVDASTVIGASYLPLAGGTMTGNIDFNDSVRARFGNGNDLQIVHDGSNSYIHNVDVGDLYIRQTADDKDIIFQSDDGSGGTATYMYLDGGGGLTRLSRRLRADDGVKIEAGSTGDLQIYHDGSNSYIVDTGVGTLNLRGSTQVLIGGTNGEVGVQYVENAGVGLRHNNVTKLTTESTGVLVAGDIQIDSALLSNQENTDVDTGTETVASVAIATYTAAFFDFVIKKTTNVRSGTVYACHDGTNVEFTETSTNDLGDTSDVTLSVDISGTNMRLLATVTSDDWSVKSLIRAI